MQRCNENPVNGPFLFVSITIFLSFDLVQYIICSLANCYQFDIQTSIHFKPFVLKRYFPVSCCESPRWRTLINHFFLQWFKEFNHGPVYSTLTYIKNLCNRNIQTVTNPTLNRIRKNYPTTFYYMYHISQHILYPQRWKSTFLRQYLKNDLNSQTQTHSPHNPPARTKPDWHYNEDQHEGGLWAGGAANGRHHLGFGTNLNMQDERQRVVLLPIWQMDN